MGCTVYCRIGFDQFIRHPEWADRASCALDEGAHKTPTLIWGHRLPIIVVPQPTVGLTVPMLLHDFLQIFVYVWTAEFSGRNNSRLPLYGHADGDDTRDFLTSAGFTAALVFCFQVVIAAVGNWGRFPVHIGGVLSIFIYMHTLMYIHIHVCTRILTNKCTYVCVCGAPPPWWYDQVVFEMHPSDCLILNKWLHFLFSEHCMPYWLFNTSKQQQLKDTTTKTSKTNQKWQNKQNQNSKIKTKIPQTTLKQLNLEIWNIMLTVWMGVVWVLGLLLCLDSWCYVSHFCFRMQCVLFWHCRPYWRSQTSKQQQPRDTTTKASKTNQKTQNKQTTYKNHNMKHTYASSFIQTLNSEIVRV